MEYQTQILIKLVVTQRDKLYEVHIHEDWDEDLEYAEFLQQMQLNNVQTAVEQLDQRVEWSTEQLVKWPGCNRTAYDRWTFDTEENLNKFIVLYGLMWTH